MRLPPSSPSRKCPRLLSADEAEKLKVIVWTSQTVDTRFVHQRMERKLPADMVKKVVKARVYGSERSCRVELFTSSRKERDALLETLARCPLGLANERHARGRTYASRQAASEANTRAAVCASVVQEGGISRRWQQVLCSNGPPFARSREPVPRHAA